MPRRKIIRGESTTRQEILSAATTRFASASYDDVGLRDIAADVGVDVAYVHRSFGSKEHLFREVLHVSKAGVDFSEIDPRKLAASLARMLFDRKRQKKRLRKGDPLLIVIRSLASPAASRLVGEQLQNEFIQPISKKLGDPNQLRTSVIMSLLIGFSVLQNLLQLPGGTGIDLAQAETLIADAIERIMKLDSIADRRGA